MRVPETGRKSRNSWFSCRKRIGSRPFKVASLRIMSFYAVARGRQTGIFGSWSECQEQIKGFSGPKFKKFSTQSEAQEFLAKNQKSSSSSSLQKLAMPTANLEFKRELHSLKNSLQNMRNSFQKFMTEKQEESRALEDKIDILLQDIPQQDASIEPDSVPPLKKARLLETSELSGSDLIKNGDGLLTDTDGYVHVYTDGSCEFNGQARARAGYGVWWADGHALNRGEAASRPTNNVGEIEAATEAIVLARSAGIKKLKLHTDSMFVINCVTQWMDGWKKNGWITSKKEPVKNKMELEHLDAALSDKSLQIEWVHVRGHVGIKGNEEADRLARLGAEKFLRKQP